MNSRKVYCLKVNEFESYESYHHTLLMYCKKVYMMTSNLEKCTLEHGHELFKQRAKVECYLYAIKNRYLPIANVLLFKRRKKNITNCQRVLF